MSGWRALGITSLSPSLVLELQVPVTMVVFLKTCVLENELGSLFLHGRHSQSPQGQSVELSLTQDCISNLHLDSNASV